MSNFGGDAFFSSHNVLNLRQIPTILTIFTFENNRWPEYEMQILSTKKDRNLLFKLDSYKSIFHQT